MMVEAHRIVARVAELRSNQGRTPCELYKPGDEFDMTIQDEREKICRWAYNSMFPITTAMEFGGTLPWEPDSTLVACPNPQRIVVFELRREGKRTVESCCWK
ncbi:MAG: TIGR04076 family protein [Candidatus Thorarchaeota archaeon]